MCEQTPHPYPPPQGGRDSSAAGNGFPYDGGVIITTRFSVTAPLDVVWRYMLDVRKIAPCVPGAELTEVINDKTYAGKIGVKLGPIEVAYRGKIFLEEVDEQAHTVRLRGEGQESKGRGGASATVTAEMHEDGGQTVVSMDSEVGVTGLVAQFGRSAIMQDISQRMAQRFADCLEREIKAAQAVPG